MKYILLYIYFVVYLFYWGGLCLNFRLNNDCFRNIFLKCEVSKKKKILVADWRKVWFRLWEKNLIFKREEPHSLLWYYVHFYISFGKPFCFFKFTDPRTTVFYSFPLHYYYIVPFQMMTPWSCRSSVSDALHRV